MGILHNKKLQKKIWIFLAAIILPAFVFWGSGSIIQSKKQSGYAGKLFGKNISYKEYAEAENAVKNQLIIHFGHEFTKIQKLMDLEAQTWDRIILLKEAKKRKIAVKDKEVVDLISGYQIFQKKNQFDQKIYTRMLTYLFRTQPRRFEEQIRQNLILAKLYENITKDVSLDKEESLKEYKKENEQISIEYIAGVYSDFLDDKDINEATLESYFAENSVSFKRPPSFNVEYIFSEDENKIKTFYSLARKKRNFSELAKEMDLELRETGFFSQTDPIPEIGWMPQISALISKAKPSDILPPVLMDKNLYVFCIKENKGPYIPELNEIREKVKEAFMQHEAKKLVRKKMESCLGLLLEANKQAPGKTDFASMAKKTGLKSGSTNLFKYGSYIEGIGASDNFFIAARELNENDLSRIIESKSGLYIFKRKEFIPIDENKFQMEKETFSQNLLLKKKQKYFQNHLNELRNKAGLSLQ